MGRSSDLAVIDRLFRWGAAVGDDDARLLERFRDGRDEAAFAALVDRHGPMVLGVCRRSLRDDGDVEDAFQATFLILARRAGTIRGVGGVGPWLHGVAHRVATRARADSARRFVREGVRLEAEPPADAPVEAERRELRSIVDDELRRLPGRFRDPVVLCHLEGLTHDQAADRLRLPVGTVRSRLARARTKLRDRLERRGLSAADAPALLPFAEPLPPALLEATLRSSLASATAPASTLAAAGAVALADGVLQAMIVSKAKLAAVALGTLLTLGGASGYALQQGGESKPDSPADSASKATAPQQRDDLKRDILKRDLARDEAVLSELEARRDRLNAEIEAARTTVARSRRLLAKDSRAGRGSPVAKPEASPLAKARAGMMGGPGAVAAPGMEGPGLVGASGPDRGGERRGRGSYVSGDSLVIAYSSTGRVLTGYSTTTGRENTLRIAPDGPDEIRVTPVVGSGLAAIQVEGPKVERIAVFSAADGEWHPQDLREPTSRAVPMIGANMAAYRIGDRIYAFSGEANRWDVLELPDEPPAPEEGMMGMMPGMMGSGGMMMGMGGMMSMGGTSAARSYPVVGPNCLTYQTDHQLHIFSAATGRWTSLEIENPEESKDPKPNP